jgi:hypothetical protein
VLLGCDGDVGGEEDNAEEDRRTPTLASSSTRVARNSPTTE